jgi:hypothetical protein
VPEVVELSLGLAGSPDEVVLKLEGGDNWELNVWSTFEHLARLVDIRAANWDERKSIEAGHCAGARVFWCSHGDTAMIMIGHDDETWDFAVQVDVTIVDAIAEMAGQRRVE